MVIRLFLPFVVHHNNAKLQIEVEESILGLTKEVKNLRVVFYQHLNFKCHIMPINKGAYFQLYIQYYNKAAETAIYAFVTQILDCANELLYGLPKYVIYNLQKVQNSAACTLISVSVSDHLTPALQDLHWLPVRCRVVLRVLTFMYKVKTVFAPAYLSLWNPINQP